MEFPEIDKNYLKNLVSFLYSVKFSFVLNTHYLIDDIITENRDFLEHFQYDFSDSHRKKCLKT